MPLSTTQYGYIIDPLVPLTDDTGRTISNGYVRVFMAGTSTPVITYKNFDGATNEETVQLDNSGRTAYPVIGSKGSTYKVCVYDAEHSQETPIKTIDKVVPTGASVSATNVVTGLDNVESPEAGWVKSTVSGTDAEVSLDATNVTSEVDTMVKATAASADYMIPLVHKTGSDPDKKITIGNIFKFVLNFIHSLTDTATESDIASGNYFALDGSAGTKKLNSTTLLTKTAQNAQKWNVGASQELFVFRTNVGISTSGSVGASVSKYGFTYNGHNQAVVPCKAGDAFVVQGVGGDTCRLWAFTDEERKLVSASVADLDGSNGILLCAPVDGYLYVNCANTLYHLYKIAQKITENSSVNFESEYAKLAKNEITSVTDNYINTNVDLGDTISLTPTTSSTYVHQVVDCVAGERFFVFGSCGSNPRLWAFIDSDGKLVSRYTGSEGVVSETEINAPCDGKLIVNVNKNVAYGLYNLDVSATLADSKNKNEKINVLDERVDILSRIRLNNWNINGAIRTSDAVGTTISLQPADSTYLCLVADCNEGDEFFVIGAGGSNSRLWAFVDADNKIVSQSAASVSTTTGIKLVAPANGKLVVNTASNVPRDVSVVKSSAIYGEENDVRNDVDFVSLVDVGEWVERSYIKTNVAYGSSVSLTPVANDCFRHKIINCVVGDVVYLRSRGVDAPRSWAYINSSGNLVSRMSTSSAQSDTLVFTAPCDGKLIVNDSYSDYAFTRAPNASQKYENDVNLEQRVSDIEDKLPPNTIFDVKTELPNVASYVAEFDYSTTAQEQTILEQVYTAFDELVTDYPDYVSRVDAAEEAGIEYPEYANGYDGVPAYKMYMYKFESSFVGAGNENGVNPKKKLFIIAGQHGNEIAAPANSYIFAKKLCEASEENFFKLRTCYDVYIIPCVNGFGLYKLTRVNGNGVDLNRNYPIERWQEHGQQGDDNYSGPSAGSEFETQVVCAIFNDLHPDFAVDHHNYADGTGGNQFYMTGRQKFLLKLCHQFLEECSFTFIKDLPAYFGTAYKLFKLDVASNMPASLASDADATACVWFGEAGALCCMTLEMSSCINFYGGQPVATGQGKDLYGNDTFAVGQFTLAGILFKAAGYLCAKIP